MFFKLENLENAIHFLANKIPENPTTVNRHYFELDLKGLIVKDESLKMWVQKHYLATVF